MSRPGFTIEIHPRAWYALANLPQEAYERIKRGLAGVAESLGGVQDPQAPGTRGGWLSLDGYLAHYTVQPERRCVTVMDIERSAPGRFPPPGGANVLRGSAAPAAERPHAPNVLAGAGAALGATPGSDAPSTAPMATSAPVRPNPEDA